MLGHLVPCSGGRTIPLRRERVYLGRRPQVDKSLALGAETALCRLRHSGGRWHVDDLGLEVVRVNGRSIRTQRLNPGDELSIGKMRFRIAFDAPESTDQSAEAIAADVLGAETDSQRPVSGQKLTASTENGIPIPVGSIPHGGMAASDSPRIAFQPARLVPLGGGPDHLVSQPKVTIGRKEHCDIVLPFSTVSSTHCGLEFIDGYWQVLDLGSRNGIRVDGVRCTKAWIYPDSRLSIADRRFELNYVPQGERPEPEESRTPYSKPLMATLGISQKQMDESLARHHVEEQEEPQRKRYDLLDDL